MNSTPLSISPERIVRAMAIIAVSLVVAGLATQAGVRWSGRYFFYILATAFNLDGENNVPSWFATVCLFLCAIILLGIGGVRWKQNKEDRFYWIGLSVIFLGLSLDEAASIHEWAVLPLRKLLRLSGGYLHFAWVIPGGIFALAVGLATRKFLTRLPSSTRKWFFLSGLIYCSGALGMELIGGKYASAYGMRDWTYVLIATVEESLEMLGTLLFLRALLLYWRQYAGEMRLTCAGPDRRAQHAEFRPELQRVEAATPGAHA